MIQLKKWFKQLVPASANLPPVRNIVEGHIFDRGGKYPNKFPSTGKKIGVIEGTAGGSGE